MIFLGCLFDREKENMYLENSKIGLSNAANTFQWNLIDGFNENLSVKIRLINVLPVGTFPFRYKKLILKSNLWSYCDTRCSEIGCINLPFIKQFQRYVTCKKHIKKSGDKDIIIYSAYLPFLKAIYKLDKSYNITVIITDLPEFYDLGKTSLIKRIFRNINNKKIYKYLERVDNFVVLTEQMKKPLHIGDRPYTVVEGICNPPNSFEDYSKESKEKIILYTGTLHSKFGIGNLLEAFSQIEDDDYRLWICGGGELKQQIEKIAEQDKRIKFWGYVTKSQIFELQQKSTVLVNPRQNNEEFTKYSFPSKTMEYMASGKPVLMYKLDGIPDEYDEYLNYVNGNSVEHLKCAIVNLCEKSNLELFNIGKRAKEFVLTNKSSLVQAKKIIDFLNE